MEFFQTFYDGIFSFFWVGSSLRMFRSGGYSALLTWEGIRSAMSPLVPFLLIIELIRAAFWKKFNVSNDRISVFISVFNRFIGRYIPLGMVVLGIGLFEKYAIVKTSPTRYWFICRPNPECPDSHRRACFARRPAVKSF